MKNKLFKKIKNYLFCLKYPFLRMRNRFSDKVVGYENTEYDFIPIGWRKAFGKQLIKDLKIALKKDGILKTFRFMQIKEKYGELCLYNNGCGKFTQFVIDKYSLLSLAYCIKCGKPTRYISDGYILFLCEDCVKKHPRFKPELLKDWRLNKDDIPQIDIYEDNLFKSVDIKSKYNIDFTKLWDI